MSAVAATLAPYEGVSSTVLCNLPKPYQIMPHTIPFVIPGFEKHCSAYDFTLAPENIVSGRWFSQFTDRVCTAIGKTYLPVCRASDGEFLFLFGHQPPSLRWKRRKRLVLSAKNAAVRFRTRFRGFKAATALGVSSGEMSWQEWRRRRDSLSNDYLQIMRDGILALHLNFSTIPCQEHYFPPLGRWLQQSGITPTSSNYVPFYFVYALLRGPRCQEVLADRDLVVIHSATGEKRCRIEESLRAEGVRRVQWITISPARSFADVIDLSQVSGQPELCLIGAGVGKAAIFQQLKPLNLPCIDAGFVFEVWADPDKRWDRPMMVPDSVYELDKLRFIDADLAAFARASHSGDVAAMQRIVNNVRQSLSIRE